MSAAGGSIARAGQIWGQLWQMWEISTPRCYGQNDTKRFGLHFQAIKRVICPLGWLLFCKAKDLC